MSALPNLIVLGAMKAGTSALHDYLALHPEIVMSQQKELNFFLSDEDLAPDRADRLRSSLNWSRGIDWYTRQFDARAAVRGESSPNYTSPEHVGVAKRMHSVLPDAKLIFLARDPVSRALSQYRHNVLLGHEAREVDVALQDLSSGYVRRSQYTACLRPFTEYYGAERILVLTQERLLAAPVDPLRRAFMFLGLSTVTARPIEKRRAYETDGLVVERTAVSRFRSTRLGGRLEGAAPRGFRDAVKRAVGSQVAPELVTMAKQTPAPETLDIIRNAVSEDARCFAASHDLDLAEWPSLSAGQHGSAHVVQSSHSGARSRRSQSAI